MSANGVIFVYDKHLTNNNNHGYVYEQFISTADHHIAIG